MRLLQYFYDMLQNTNDKASSSFEILWCINKNLYPLRSMCEATNSFVVLLQIFHALSSWNEFCQKNATLNKAFSIRSCQNTLFSDNSVPYHPFLTRTSFTQVIGAAQRAGARLTQKKGASKIPSKSIFPYPNRYISRQKILFCHTE